MNEELTFPSSFDKYSPGLKAMVTKMLKKNPKERYSSVDCLRDSWMLGDLSQQILSVPYPDEPN